MPETTLRPLAVVTGASSGIGYELARCFADSGYDLIIAADEPAITEAAEAFVGLGADARALQVDLATREGVRRLVEAVGERPVDALVANAGRGLGEAFLDQDFDDVLRVVNTNVTGTLDLVQSLVRPMRERGRGRVLITGSIAGLMPGAFQAVYNGTKAFIDSFALALRNELKDSGVSVTCLMPGPTDTEFFERAGLLDTKFGRAKKDNPAEVARVGFEAMMRGDGDVVSGIRNKVQAAVAAVAPQSALAELHRIVSEPHPEHR